MAKKSTKKSKEKEVLEEVKEEVVQEEGVNDVNKETEESEAEVEDQKECLSEVDTLKNTVSELNNKYLRLTAEYDNYRKRTLKERLELIKTAGESLLIGLLPVVDDFDRALDHLSEDSDLEAVKEGIGLIYNKFRDYLSQKGVKEIDAKDKEFDTDLHEAITKIPAPTKEMKGKVIDCVEKGYLLNDKVMRFSKVVVGE